MDDALAIKAVYSGPERVGQELEEFCDHSGIFALRSSDWQGEIGCVPDADLPKYLSKFGYKVSTPGTWFEEAPKGADWPKLTLGDVNGHFEAHGHTWYNILCHLKVDGVAASHWRVPRRLCQMRLLLHDLIKSALGNDYKRHFETTRFAAHGAPPGTTDVIQAWLRTLCRCINEGQFSPHLVALTLRFIEADALFDAEDRPIDRTIANPNERVAEVAASQTPSWARPEVGAGPSTDDQLPDNSTTVAEDFRDGEATMQASGDARPGTASSSDASADLQGVSSTEEAAPCPTDMDLLRPQESEVPEARADDAVLLQLAKDVEFAEEEDDGPMMSELM